MTNKSRDYYFHYINKDDRFLTELATHPHCDELLNIMLEQVRDDREVV